MSRAPQTGEKLAAETRLVEISMYEKLGTSETITGTPTITPSPSGLTFTTPTVSTTVRTINGVSVPIGQAILAYASVGTAAVSYVNTVSCTTSGSQTLGGTFVIDVI